MIYYTITSCDIPRSPAAPAGLRDASWKRPAAAKRRPTVRSEKVSKNLGEEVLPGEQHSYYYYYHYYYYYYIVIL